ncbi:hypothetical protein [uncultured Eubacterium sp.]|jgi:chromosome segregation ATPase|uniref:hypothetical protein n=1 Tax=Eubacterium sp. TaxID=142586 RepID=UPI002063F0E6|nr:hypothetical protein [uncultured Eubacterium sp.]DAX02905.1 MAG TPA: hypothetical protein [Bacteriophage sp.]
MIIIEDGLERDATEEELKMIEEYENAEKELMQKNEELADLERILSESDYKIIKSYENSLIGKELEYDIEQLHIERQNMRDKINEVKNEVAKLKERLGGV